MLRAFTIGLVLALAFAASASARTVHVGSVLGSLIPDSAAIDVPVLLPGSIDLDYPAGKVVYGEATGIRKGHYALSLSAVQGCDGANACFLAEFFGSRGSKLGYKSTNVDLALGQKGHYQPSHCGASCAPASISWIQKGVRYEIAANALGGKAAFVRWANNAIRAGNRG